jgi:hypothetical protein
VGVRPEDLCAPEQAGPETHVVVDVTVARAESLGSELIVYFEPVTERAAVESAADAGANGTRDATAVLAAATPRLLTARLDRTARLRDPGPGQLGVRIERLYFFDPRTGQAIEH